MTGDKVHELVEFKQEHKGGDLVLGTRYWIGTRAVCSCGWISVLVPPIPGWNERQDTSALVELHTAHAARVLAP